jgi:hypothetical protein
MNKKALDRMPIPQLTDIFKSWQQSDSFKEMQKNLCLLQSNQARVMESFHKSLRTEELQRGLKLIQEFQAGLASRAVEIGEGMRKFKKHLPEQLQTLAENGWFIQGDLTPLQAIYPVAGIFRKGNVVEGNRQMCAHIKESLDGIEDNLVRDFPKRAVILKRAFDAARAGDYVASVPLMLMQADGIGREIFAKNTARFSITSKQPKFQTEIKKFIDQNARNTLYTSDIYEVILKAIPLNASEGDTMLLPGALNRNAVLHGLDSEYYTEVNAMRAASWIGYISYFNK